MARRFTEVDVSKWKLVSYSGKPILDDKGRQLKGFNGYKSAMAVAFNITGAVAVRE